MAKQKISQKVAYGVLHGECKQLINLALEEGYDLRSTLAQVKVEILAKRDAHCSKKGNSSQARPCKRVI